MQTRKGLVFVLLVLMMVLGTVLTSAAPITIDTFNDGNGSGGESWVCDEPGRDGCLVTIPGIGTFTILDRQVYDVSVIGGQRDLYVTQVSGTGTANMRVNQGSSGRLSYATDPSSVGAAEVVWDGQDNDPLNLDRTGLGSVDLTDGGLNNGLQLIVYFTDGGFDLTIHVINDTLESDYELTLTSAVAAPGVSFFIPFTDFVEATEPGVTGPVDFADVGAIKFEIEHTAQGVDLEIDLFEATSNTDFGDLPEGYNATIVADNGARHIVDNIFLGNIIDRESDGLESTDATGDDTQDLDDEDGIIIPSGPTNSFGDGSADIQYTVNGGPGCLVGWIDWNDDNFFNATTSGTNNASELVINTYVGAAQVGSQQTASITTPLYQAGGYEYPQYLFARFRLFPPNDSLFGGNVDANGCPDESAIGTALSTLIFGEASNGEVEDYRIEFTGPTAVNLQSFTPATSALPIAGVVGFLALAVVSLGAFLVRREQR